MKNDELPCLNLLDATPAILRGLMSEITEEDARWKPAPDRFSIAEVLAHLSHSEGHCYRARLDRFVNEQMPEFEPDDAQMHLELYKNRDPEDDFQHFEDQREANIELLRGLPVHAGSRKARHQAAGEITLAEMLHEWALHDLGHIRQIAELVRARKYLPGAGPLGADYRLKP
ncbi:MAG TPA: DinB family protein [Bryobacteraceae bacterium]|nr:DinB family protein [Bryobacteraceae bacterium]